MKPMISISGTSRPDNYTAQALAVVNERIRESEVSVIEFDARQLELNFTGQPMTDDARRLREAIEECDAVILATPEYHGTFSAMTKLIIENLGFPSALEGKTVSLLGVAAGRIGAIKSLQHLRGVCAHVGAVVLPGAVSVAGVRNAFDDDGNCIDDDVAQMLSGLADHTLAYQQTHICPARVLEGDIRAGEEDASPWSATL